METAPRRWQRGEFAIDTDPARIDVAVVHGFLTTCYWSKGIPRAVVERAIAGSLNFGVFHGTEQVGFARVVTDGATFAYVGDVFVLEAWRGRGLSKWLMECMTSHPALQGLRRWVLATRDAHGLYGQFGFTGLAHPERWMHRWDPEIYTRPATGG